MHKRTDDIMVIDDEANYAEMIVNLLDSVGYRAEMRTSPAAALDALRQRTYSLVISDYKMPGLDGSEFLKQMREVHPTLPVIMISGYMNTPELLKVANIGVTLVLEKPFDTAVFMENVRRFADPVQEQEEVAAPAGLQKARAPSSPYPAGSTTVSEASPLAREFLQDLWDGLHRGGVVLAAPLGTELDLVIRDVEGWFSLQPPTLRISPSMLEHPELYELVPDALTLVDARDGRLPLPAQLEGLRGRLPPKVPLIVVVRKAPDAPLGSLPVVHLPLLSTRPQDVAAYTSRALQRHGEGRTLSNDAMRLLLNYPWPGNYHELMGALRRVLAVKEPNEIHAASIATIIEEGHGSVQPGAEATTLETYLRRRQLDLLSGSTGTDLADALRSAGVEPDRMEAGKSLAQQPLLYPELLRGE